MSETTKIIKDFHKRADDKRHKYNQIFTSLILITILDAIIMFAVSMNNIRIYNVAWFGLLLAIALSGVTLLFAIDANKDMKNIQSVYEEIKK